MFHRRGRVLTRITAPHHAAPVSAPRGAAARGRRRRGGFIRTMTLAALAAVAAAACNATSVATPASTPTAAAATPAPTVLPTEPPATPVPSPTIAATASTSAASCTAADLKASHGFVEGAAGSRLTIVSLVSAITCSLDAFPALGIRDAGGAILVGAASSGPGRIEIVAGERYEVNVRIGNWCADQPDFPLTLEVVMGAEHVPVTGGSFPEEGDLPPCNGDGGPILEATGWVAVP